MKKLYYIMTLMFITLLASCSQEEMVNKETENNRVSISAELPGDIAATRAQVAIPSTHKLRCIIEVWTKSSNPSLKYREEIAVAGGTLPAFDFALRPGDYTCLMWADIIAADAASTEVTTVDGVTYNHFEDTFYNTSDLNRITIKDVAAANLFDTELCDGFYANLEVKKNATAVDKAMKLTRPFAKLIVKETDAEKFATLTGLTVSFEMPKTFSVATGEPGTEKLTAVYSKNFASAGDASILYTGYVFTPSTGLSLDATILTFKMAKGEKTREIPGESITLKRNEQITAAGSLIGGGVLEPTDPEEPGTDPKVGDYFFIDGTWSNELTEANKANCVGIVYAVGAQSGDDISNYPNSDGKSIKGYVMGLQNTGVPKDIFPSDNAQYLLSNSRPYFYKQKQEGGAKDDAVTVLAKGGDPDWTKYDGCKATQEILSTAPFLGASDPLHYPALLIFSKWRETAVEPVNASEWYFPASGQLYEACGKCYGFTPTAQVDIDGGAQKIEVNDALIGALLKAIEEGIATNFPASTNEKGYYVYTSSMGRDAMPMAIQVGAGKVTSLYPKPNYKTQGVIRPFLTIIK